MQTADQDASQRNPQEGYRSVHRTEQRAENGAQSGDVQQLDQKGFPFRERQVIYAVITAPAGRFAVGIGADCPFEVAAVNKVGSHEYGEAD